MTQLIRTLHTRFLLPSCRVSPYEVVVAISLNHAFDHAELVIVWVETHGLARSTCPSCARATDGDLPGKADDLLQRRAFAGSGCP